MKVLYFLTLCCLITFYSPAKPGEKDTLLAKSYLDIGLKFLKSGQYDSAYHYYSLGTDIYKNAHDNPGYGKGLYSMALALHFPGNSKEALPLYLSSLKILSKELPENDLFINDLYNNIGACYIDQGNRFEAKKYLQKALEIDMEIYGKDSLSTAVTSYNLGLTSMYFGEHQASLQYFMNALPVYLNKYGQNGSRVAQLYTNVGLIHQDLCDYETARDYYNRAIAIHMENHGDTYWNLAYPYTSLGETYELIGNNEMALAFYQKALKLTDTQDRDLTRLKSVILGLLGKYYGKKDDYEKALKYTNDAIRLIKETYFEDHPRLSDFYRIEGNIYKKQGKYELANSFYEKAIQNVILNYGMTHPILAKNYGEQADMFLQMGDYESALSSVQKGINSINLQFDRSEFLETPEINSSMDKKELLNLVIIKGDIYRKISLTTDDKTPNLKSALDEYLLATDIIDHIRRELLSEGSKLYLQKNANSVYQKAIQTCSDLYEETNNRDYIKKAFYFMEKSKGAVLSEALQTANLIEIHGVPENVILKEKEINRFVKSVELKFADSEKNENDSLQKSLSSQLFHAKISQDSLARVIKNRYPDYYNLKYNEEIISLDKAQQNLSENTMILSYFEGDSEWFVLTVLKNDFHLNSIQKSSLKNIDLNNLFKYISDGASDISILSKLSFNTYQTFVEPYISDHTEIRKMIVVPDGLLGYVPMDALVCKDPELEETPSKPHYLIENYTVSYANSLTLISQKSKYPKDEKYVGFAPEYSIDLTPPDNRAAFRNVLSDLSGTQEEVKQAGKLFAGKTFLNEDATEYNFKHLESSPAILHLAMHAIIEDKDPMRSRLMFTRESDTIDDSELNAYEIYGIRIGSQLAVLSACNTGVGEINRGEGVMSLSRAFMYAGCPNIVMSLWRAKDQPTTLIMTDFFGFLKKEMSKDEALRMAKLNYLQTADPLKAHPANWATFVFFGDPEPLSFGLKYKKYWIAAIILFFVITSFFYYRRKKKREERERNNK